MIEIDNETYAAVQTLGKDVVVELARGLVRARKLHPVFAESAAEGAAVVYTEASELVASVHDREPAARQRAEAVDTAVTAIRYMGKFGVTSPVETSEGVKVAYDSDDDFEGVSEAPVTLYEMMEQTAQEEDEGGFVHQVRTPLPKTTWRKLHKEDEVNHPPHYTAGGIECIDAIKAALTPEEFAGYCKGNLIKYAWRERHKGGLQSLEKGQWYLQKLIDNYPGGDR